MNKKDFIEQVKKIDSVRATIGSDTQKFYGWQSTVISFLSQFEPMFNRHIEVIKNMHLVYGVDELKIQKVHNQLTSVLNLVESDAIILDKNNETSGTVQLERILCNFKYVANQLKKRHANRPTIEIEDEYDVQDLLHALLKIDFKDVRAETEAPEFAGGSTRMDFLIEDIETVIEVKKTRKSMTVKDLGEQLIIDIEKYQTHENCKMLYCFIYDPDMYISNPKGIIDDLESNHKGFLRVIITQ